MIVNENNRIKRKKKEKPRKIKKKRGKGCLECKVVLFMKIHNM
jgi:hypothetical protein